MVVVWKKKDEAVEKKSLYSLRSQKPEARIMDERETTSELTSERGSRSQ